MYSVVTYSTLLNSEQSWSLLKINGADSGRTQQRHSLESGPKFVTGLPFWSDHSTAPLDDWLQSNCGNPDVRRPHSGEQQWIWSQKHLTFIYSIHRKKNSFLGVRSRKKILSQRELNNFRRGRNHLIAVIRKDSCESTSTFHSSGDVQFCRNSNQFHSRRHYIRLSVK